MRNEELDGWIRDAAEIDKHHSPKDRWGIGELGEDNVHSMGNDIADIYESLSKASISIDALVEGTANPAALEDCLVDVEIELAHAVHHWRRLTKMLRGSNLWMTDDLIDRPAR
jgi:hypothetical protein